VVRIEDDDVTVIADRFEGRRFNSPNDAAIRSDGSLWFTDPPWGLTGKAELPGHWVFRIDADGQVQPVIKDLAMPNGICFSPDESRLYVADTGGNPRHPDRSFHNAPACIRCYAVTAEGEIEKLLFTIDQGSDGMAVDALGNIYTTHGNQVVIFDADGKRVEAIEVPESPANVCFGGDDYRTLFITAQTSLYRVPMRVAGTRPKGAKW
jgi:gluconolactonase